MAPARSSMTKEVARVDPGAIAVDPVCGMTVYARQAAAACEHEGRRYYFCASGCLQRFQSDPGKYLRAKEEPTQATKVAPRSTIDESASSGAGVFTCPMHPEVRQDGPGSCPRCGMALEPLVGGEGES